MASKKEQILDLRDKVTELTRKLTYALEDDVRSRTQLNTLRNELNVATSHIQRYERILADIRNSMMPVLTTESHSFVEFKPLGK